MGRVIFTLAPGTEFITGARRAAVYHLPSGEVYSVDEEGRAILERAIAGTDTVDPTSEAFLQELERCNLGTLRSGEPRRGELVPARRDGPVRRLWLELTEACNLRCIHCYARAANCRPSSSLSPEEFGAVLDSAAALGCRNVQFIGGEPLLYPKRELFRLLQHARDGGYEIVEVFTNGTLLDDEHVATFVRLRVAVAVSIYAGEPGVHDSIAGCTGSFALLRRALDKVTAAELDVRAGLVIMNQNCCVEAETRAWLAANYPAVRISTDIVRCTAGGRATPGQLLTPALLRRRVRSCAQFACVSEETFRRRQQGHPCLDGSLCVHADGKVYPCIMDRTTPFGQVPADTLEEIVLRSDLREIWGKSHDAVPVCRDCEFRYACTDCPPLARSLRTAVDASPNPLCTYDPYRGIWNDPAALDQA